MYLKEGNTKRRKKENRILLNSRMNDNLDSVVLAKMKGKRTSYEENSLRAHTALNL